MSGLTAKPGADVFAIDVIWAGEFGSAWLAGAAEQHFTA